MSGSQKHRRGHDRHPKQRVLAEALRPQQGAAADDESGQEHDELQTVEDRHQPFGPETGVGQSVLPFVRFGFVLRRERSGQGRGLFQDFRHRVRLLEDGLGRTSLLRVLISSNRSTARGLAAAMYSRANQATAANSPKIASGTKSVNVNSGGEAAANMVYTLISTNLLDHNRPQDLHDHGRRPASSSPPGR